MCSHTAPGFPGHPLEGLVSAVGDLGYMIALLFFVNTVLLAFSSGVTISSNDHVLAALGGGLAPIILVEIYEKYFKPDNGDCSLNTYFFEGKVLQEIGDLKEKERSASENELCFCCGKETKHEKITYIATNRVTKIAFPFPFFTNNKN